MAAAKPNKAVQILSSVAVFGMALGLLGPRTATDVQTIGDGAEIAAGAVLGSLLHPPGFPIFSHINHTLVSSIDGSAYAILARTSAVTHSLAAGLLVWVLSTWLRSTVLAIGLSSVVFFAPSALKVASDAEVFALHHLFSVCLLWTAMALYRRKVSIPGFFALGFLFGLAGAHQPLAVFWLPLVLLPLTKEKHRWEQRLLAALLGGLFGLLPYVSLFAFYERAPALAFGHLETFSDLFHHVLRTTYGTFKLSGNFTSSTTLFFPLMREVFLTAPALLALWVYGAVRGYEERNSSRLVFSFIFVGHLVFLHLAQLPNTPAALELGSRFHGSVFLALVAGALPGCFYFLQGKDRKSLLLLFAVLVLPAMVHAPKTVAALNLHQNRVTRDLLDATFDHLPENSVFIAQHDAEAFGALHDQAVHGKRKDVYVVVEGRLPAPWYRDQIAQTLPFLHGKKVEKEGALLRVIGMALSDQRRVFLSFPIRLGLGMRLRPTGVGWEVFLEEVPSDDEIIRTVLQTCVSVTQKFEAPSPLSGGNQALLNNLAAGYVALGQTLKAQARENDGLRGAVEQLQRGQGFGALRQVCRTLLAEAKPAALPQAPEAKPVRAP